MILFAITLHVAIERRAQAEGRRDARPRCSRRSPRRCASPCRTASPPSAARLSERGGVINIALEGILLVGALGLRAGRALHGLGAGPGWPRPRWPGVLVALRARVRHRDAAAPTRSPRAWDQPGRARADARSSSRSLRLEQQLARASPGLPQWDVPLVGRIPFVGPLLGNPLFLLAALLVAAAWIVLFRTPFGLRLRAAGEHPEAPATLGLSVAAAALRRRRSCRRRVRGPRRRVARRRAALVHRRHVRRPRLHRARGDDRRQVATRAARSPRACSSAPRDAADPAPGRRAAERSSCRCCPTS